MPGVLGTYESLEDQRTTSGELYTRPEELLYKEKSLKVPKVLISGNHKEIEGWRGKKV